ncbi:hypothetical protein [Methylobacterium sp. Leaf93]|uniref:hypothetical protein n=1 Tax=Methylobacterium sp. Leaf93 TaxID=1736249 RepID=UPI0006F51C4D|nr:hypothetical protein [Methylobacterium sp. Leaf93]KQP03920.1 hypothetical protein ASF26_12120 [Methylobacterium sp. Leaf93]
MRTVFMTMSLCLPMAFAGPAQAEDFTGFYAGVNAGYAFGRDKSARTPDMPFLSSTRGADDRALPPSALQASEVMRGARPKALTSATIR